MRQALVIARHTLAEHIRSWQFLVEVLPAAAIVALFFKYVPLKGNYAQFAAIVGLYLLLQAVVTTALIFSAAARARSYSVLARLERRWPFFLGKLLAAITAVGVTYLLLLAYLLLTRLLGFAAGQDARFLLGMGSLAMLLNVVTVSTFTALVMPLTARALVRYIVLGLFALSVFSYSVADVPSQLRLLVAPFQALTFPILYVYTLAHNPDLSTTSLVALAANVIYLLLALLLARAFFRRRELLFAP